MKNYLALLRAVNVSGKNIIKMDKLRSLLVHNGFTDVITYIQSGNIIFKSNVKERNELNKRIGDLIEEKFTCRVSVFVYELEQLEKIIENNPFLKIINSEIKKMYVTFLDNMPTEEDVKNFSSLNFESERYTIDRDIIYFYYENGYGNSKLSNNLIENKLKVTSTTRNWNTVTKLYDMMK